MFFKYNIGKKGKKRKESKGEGARAKVELDH
jgi:hypothetical protein